MFKSWLVSNITFLFILLFLVFSLVFQIPDEEEDSVVSFVMLFGACLFVHFFLATIADISGVGSILIFLLAIATIIGLFSWRNKIAVASNIDSVWLTVYLIAGVIVSVLVGIYAFINFDDVVSSRWLYRNSPVAVYEEEWLYAINRCAVTLSGFLTMAVVYWVLIMILKEAQTLA